MSSFAPLSPLPSEPVETGDTHGDRVDGRDTIEQDTPFSTPKRPSRVAKPTSKVRDTAQQLENAAKETIRRHATRTTSSGGETERPSEGRKSSSSNGRAMPHKALELLGESRTKTQWLKEMLVEQKEIISKQQDMIRDLNRQLEETEKQLGDDLKQVREQLWSYHDKRSSCPANLLCRRRAVAATVPA
ncbi:hypothetical protein AUP68_10943 [Ilyonectria robusta]